MARPAGFEPATLGLAYQLQLSLLPISAFVVWTISSPFQVPHVWPLRNPLILLPLKCILVLHNIRSDETNLTNQRFPRGYHQPYLYQIGR